MRRPWCAAASSNAPVPLRRRRAAGGMARAEAPRRQSLGFLLLYALAWAGGAIAYVPFLAILLPARMSALVGASDVEYLGYVTFCGAVAARSEERRVGKECVSTGRSRVWPCN